MSGTVREAPLSIRLTKMERATLSRRAGGMGLSTYVKSVLFVDEASGSGRRKLSADQVLLAQLLGQLGASGLASSLRSLAQAADSGSLHVDDLTMRRLHDASDDLRGIHLLLLDALGKKRPAAPKARVAVQFVRAASDVESAL